MRVAVCINGQPRTWEKCLPRWMELFSAWGDVDYFFHFWDYNTPSNLAMHITAGTAVFPISEQEKQNILDLLRPKKFMFESAKEVSVTSLSYGATIENVISWWAHPQFYSLHRAINLKRQYEIEHDFQYDIVVRLRSDLTSPPELLCPDIQPSSIYTIHNAYDPQHNVYRIGDIFFLADSLTMDHIGLFYDSFKFIDASHVSPVKDFPPEVALYYYCAMTGVKNIPLPPYDLKVMRTKEHVLLNTSLQEYETA